jgi:hypothetical protein
MSPETAKGWLQNLWFGSTSRLIISLDFIRNDYHLMVQSQKGFMIAATTHKYSENMRELKKLKIYAGNSGLLADNICQKTGW